ncbi:MAG: hypothetical protein ACI9SC_000208 [Gammaproteobacteria bacterium]|jgi:hypothetical protein
MITEHRIKRIYLSLVVLAFTTFMSGQVMATTPTSEEMWRVIQDQQRVIDELKAKLDQTEIKINASNEKIEETVSTVELTAEAIEQVTLRSEKAKTSRTSVGGYGELHYNNLSDDNQDIGGDDDSSRVDFHRFVLYFGHEFSDSIRFFSEIELEHSLAGNELPGEIELEQAWLEMDINDSHRVRAGLDILPIGIINQTHEPNTFYGVERNRVESEIIPATWWEAGIGLNGEIAPGWNYDAVIHTGLAIPTQGSSSLRPRSGRLKVAEADDQDIALTGRLRYTGMPGLEIGISGQYQADVTGTNDAVDMSATLFEGHVIWHHSSGVGLRALYARWDFDDDPLINLAGLNAESLDGFYIEPSYRFELPIKRLGEVGVFARYSQWDERNQITGAHRFENFEQFSLGFNWWPHANVALKFDAQFEDADGPVDRVLDGINLGLGYQF